MKRQKSKLAKFDKRNVNNSFPILSSLLTKEYGVSFTDENATRSAAQSKLNQDLYKSNMFEEKLKTDTLLENSALPEPFRFRKKEEYNENCVHSNPEIYSDYDTEMFSEVTEDQNENDINTESEEPLMTNDIGMESVYPKQRLTEESGELNLYILIQFR